MPEYAGRGDARRSMALMWGRCEPPARGPKQALTVDEIVTAAIAVADAEGLGALSMRKVGERLGRSAMSLYTYVPGKAELLDVMLDTALGEVPTRYDLDAGFRPAAEAAAHDGWDFYQRHPWVLQIAGSRSLLGPHETDLFEAQLAVYQLLGLPAVETIQAISAVSSFVRGSAKAVGDARDAERATGLSDNDWWAERAALFDEMAGPDMASRWPRIVAIQSQEGAFDDPAPGLGVEDQPYTVQVELATFEFGLQRMLDGLEAYAAARRRERGADG